MYRVRNPAKSRSSFSGNASGDGEMDKLLEELHGKELPEQLLEFYFCVRDFLNIDELLDENYVVYAEMGEGER